jgi:hypothetical protein
VKLGDGGTGGGIVTGMSAWRRGLGLVCAAAALGLAGAGRCRAGDEVGAPRFDPWAVPGRVRQALADRWAQLRLVPESLRRDGVERASYTAAEPGPPVQEKVGSKARPIFWWAVPRKARTVAKHYAAAQHKSVTRIVRVEEVDGTARFHVYASGREGLGLKKTPEDVLISVDDPGAKKK